LSLKSTLMKLRYARHTKDLSQIVSFYTEIVGLTISGSFQDHDGYSGVFLNTPKSAWELEFTQSERKTDHKSDPDDALVFYSKTLAEWVELKERLKNFGIDLASCPNPYWNEHGLSFLDPDGFSVIIAKPKIS
jgi:hypothetical protein